MSDWVEWGGGERPVPENTQVDVRFRCDAAGASLQDQPAQSFRWDHRDSGSDIVAYRLSATEWNAINPSHYRSHPSGIECIQVTEHMNFNLGNAVKYIWRADEKGDPIENLKKACWYVEREIARREKANASG